MTNNNKKNISNAKMNNKLDDVWKMITRNI